MCGLGPSLDAEECIDDIGFGGLVPDSVTYSFSMAPSWFSLIWASVLTDVLMILTSEDL